MVNLLFFGTIIQDETPLSSLIRFNRHLSDLFHGHPSGMDEEYISILILLIHPLCSRGKRLPRRSFFDRKSVGEVAIVPILFGEAFAMKMASK